MCKTRVLFVGGFRNPAKGGVPGGQAYACRTLIDSPLSAQINWYLIDSSQESLPPPPLARRAWLAFRRMGRFCFRLLVFRPDTVLIFTSSGLSFCEKGVMTLLARALGRRVVLCPRSGHIMTDYEQNRFFRWLIPFVLRRTSLVVCQGHEWRKYYQRIAGLDAARLPVIHNWIRAAEYASINPLQPRVDVVVLFLGWVERNKGVYEMVEAVARFRAVLARAHFVICGAGSQLEPLRHRVAEAGLQDHFEFRGWVRGEAKMRALSECDFLVLPSHREGFPNVLLEAMAAGRPVLASAVGAVPELVVPEITGLLCRPGDSQDLGEKLVRLCGDAELRMRLGAAGRRRVMEHHDVEHIWRLWWPILTR